ncbi:emp24/gp25L/p24 family/GOLD-domain-containing protein [Obelidium mucronatum]|nr:emp24/gp25L/p24 family/GOLD-domain-containing protein [Obelidium mucronatum]
MKLVVSLLLLLQTASAAILTFNMAAHERPCFYAESKYVEEKMSIYFSVQSGGDFDLDYDVAAPDGTIVMSGTKEQTGDYVFSAPQIGDFKFCFFNTVSSFAEKKFDFEILAQHEIPSRNYQKDKDLKFEKATSEAEIAKLDMKPIESSIQNMHNHYGNIIRDLRYFRSRENRNFDTVKSTENRIFWFNIIQNGIILATAIVQVIVIQTLFSKAGSGGLGGLGGGYKPVSTGPATGGYGGGGYGGSGGFGGSTAPPPSGYSGTNSGGFNSSGGYGGNGAAAGYGSAPAAGYGGSAASSGYGNSSYGNSNFGANPTEAYGARSRF